MEILPKQSKHEIFLGISRKINIQILFLCIEISLLHISKIQLQVFSLIFCTKLWFLDKAEISIFFFFEYFISKVVWMGECQEVHRHACFNLKFSIELTIFYSTSIYSTISIIFAHFYLDKIHLNTIGKTTWKEWQFRHNWAAFAVEVNRTERTEFLRLISENTRSFFWIHTKSYESTSRRLSQIIYLVQQ